MSSNATKTAAEPNWRAIFDAAIVRDGVVRVASRLGYNNHTLVSRVLHGLEPSQRFIDRVIDRYHVVDRCPATLQSQSRAECRRIALGPAPTHNPLAMRIWKVCQGCQHKPEGSQ